MTAIPPLDAAAVPRAVRAGGTAAVDGFRSALGFERMLLGELLETALPQASGVPRAASMPDTLADALVARGGIGLGLALHESFAAAEPAGSEAPGDPAAAPAAASRAPRSPEDPRP